MEAHLVISRKALKKPSRANLDAEYRAIRGKAYFPASRKHSKVGGYISVLMCPVKNRGTKIREIVMGLCA